MNCRSTVEKVKMTSKPGMDFASGSVRTVPVDGSHGVRHRGSVILFLALLWNCGNLRWQCQGKDASVKHEADSTDEPSRGGAVRSSVEGAVMAVERRGGIVQPKLLVNCVNRKNP